MKTFVLSLGFLFVSIFAVGFGFLFYGRTLPEAHQAEISVELKASPAKVWALITDYAKMPDWLSEVKKVELETSPTGVQTTWITNSHNQRLPYVTEEEIREKRLVRKISGDQAFFGGKWIYELESKDANVTHFKLREEGFIRPPLFRVMMKFSGGPEKSLRGFTESLERRLQRP